MLDGKTRLLIEDDFVEVFSREGSSPFTLVTFSSFGAFADGASYWAQSVAEKLDLSCIGIMSKAETWFPEMSVGGCLPEILPLLRGPVLIYGFSMGAYAAIKYSRRLKADTVIAFSPQATISEEDLPENSYARYFRPELHDRMLVKREDLGGVIYLFYDRLFREDRAHVALLPPSDLVRFIPVDSLRHNTNSVVIGSTVISELFRCCLARDETRISALVGSAKRRSPATYEGLSLHFLHRGKPRWAEAAHAGAQAIQNSDARTVRFAREKSVILEKEGRRAAAADSLRAALTHVPGSETLLLRLAEVLSAMGAYDDAIDFFVQAIHADGRQPAVYHGLAYAMVRAARQAEILPMIRHGLMFCPAEPSLILLEAQFGPAFLPPSARAKGMPMSDVLVDLPVLPSTAAEDKAPFCGRAPLGENYQLFLQRFHTTFRPETYLEIGVHEGATLRLSRSRTIAVDPCFRTGQLPVGNQPVCCLYQMTSDEFFRRHDPSAILGQAIDMAFLDGMHWFEFLLRDFINTEKHCRRNSIVFMHDCLPLDAHVGRRLSNDLSLQERSSAPGWWAGDVWKTLLIIARVRPDLRIVLFDAAPTGLVAITGLDPTSTILADRYFEMVDEFKEWSLMSEGRTELDRLPVLETAKFAADDALSSLFWL